MAVTLETVYLGMVAYCMQIGFRRLLGGLAARSRLTGLRVRGLSKPQALSGVWWGWTKIGMQVGCGKPRGVTRCLCKI